MNRRHSMPGVFVFLLLGLFAVLSTLMVLLCAQMYRGTVQQAGASSGDRILTSYVRTMIRGQETQGTISVEDEDGIPVLAFRERFDDEPYITRVYPYEGQLRELFTEEAFTFDPAWGEVICPVGAFEPMIEDGLVRVRMTDEAGEACEVILALRCGTEG